MTKSVLNSATDNKVFFIAEVGLNHNGNFGLLYDLIRSAAQSGADCVKFQLGWRSGPDEINALGDAEIELILRCCSRFGVEPMFSVFNRESFELLQNYPLNYFKIASRTVIEEPELVKDIVGLGKPTFVSLGMWDKESLPFPEMPNIHYLWCKSKYPSFPWDLTDMPKDFESSPYAGLSDHSVGVEVPLMSIMRGALVVEKHFTFDKSDTTIRDHALSAVPEEFAQMVQIGSAIRANLNLGV